MVSVSAAGDGDVSGRDELKKKKGKKTGVEDFADVCCSLL